MIETFLDQDKLWTKTENLLLFEKNPRKIKADDEIRLLKQLFELDQYKPSIITPDGLVLGGNMRKKGYDAILKMSATQIVDFFKEFFGQDISPDIALTHQDKFRRTFVSIVDPKSESVKMKYNLSDNDQAGYTDLDLLKKIYQEYDIDWSTYSANIKPLPSLGNIIQAFSQATEDKAPDVSTEPPLSKLGEVYQLGNHRVMVGDSTKVEDFQKLMNGEIAKVVFTSPPYNMGNGYVKYEDSKDDLASEEYVKFNLNVINVVRNFLRGFLFWNISYNKKSRQEFIEIMYKITKETGLNFMELIVWNKGHGMPITGRDMMTRSYEDVLVAGDEEKIAMDMELFFVGTSNKRVWFNKQTQEALTNYWYVPTGDTQLKNHLACFPVSLPFKAIKIMTKEGEIIIDPFGGSGTTMIAAEQLNRKCYMMELSPAYVDVIRKRYANFIGKPELWKQTVIPPQQPQN